MSRPDEQDFDLMEYLEGGDSIGMYIGPQPPAQLHQPEPEPEEPSLLWPLALILVGIITIICLSYLAHLIGL